MQTGWYTTSYSKQSLAIDMHTRAIHTIRHFVSATTAAVQIGECYKYFRKGKTLTRTHQSVLDYLSSLPFDLVLTPEEIEQAANTAKITITPFSTNRHSDWHTVYESSILHVYKYCLEYDALDDNDHISYKQVTALVHHTKLFLNRTVPLLIAQ